jgi:hypothetical protein
MAADADLLAEAAERLARTFALVPNEALLPDAEAPMEALRRYLSACIRTLLDQQPALLMSLLYRIDVAERDVKAALTQPDHRSIPDTLAELCIARQLQKLHFRRSWPPSPEDEAP